MPIDFSTLGPVRPGGDYRQESQARARTRFEQGQEEYQKKQTVEPLKAMADWDSTFAKELQAAEKTAKTEARQAETQARSERGEARAIESAERAQTTFEQGQEKYAWQKQDREKKLANEELGKITGDTRTGIKAKSIEELNEFIEAPEDQFYDLKTASADESALSTIASRLGIEKVEGALPQPERGEGDNLPYYLSRQGLALKPDGSYVVTNKFIDSVARSRAKSADLASAIAKQINGAVRADNREGLAGNPVTAQATAEEIEEMIDMIRSGDKSTRARVQAIYDRYGKKEGGKAQQAQPAQATEGATPAGEPGSGGSSAGSTPFTTAVLEEAEWLTTHPQNFLELSQQYLNHLVEQESQPAAVTQQIAELSSAGTATPEVQRDEAVRQQAIAREQFIQGTEALIARNYKDVDPAEVGAALRNEATVAEKVLDLYGGVNPQEMEVIQRRADDIASQLSGIESDNQRAKAQAIYEFLDATNPSFSKPEALASAYEEIVKDHVKGGTQRLTLADAAQNAMRHYRSSLGQTTDFIGTPIAVGIESVKSTFRGRPGDVLNREYTDIDATKNPLEKMEWEPVKGGWQLGFKRANGSQDDGFFVSTDDLSAYMKEHNIATHDDALRSLAFSTTLGDVAQAKDGLLFAMNPYTKQVEENATLPMNPVALYDKALYQKSLDGLRSSGMSEEAIAELDQKYQTAKARSASQTVEELNTTYEQMQSMAELTGSKVLGKILEPDSSLDFRNFYNAMKRDGMNDEYILTAWNEKEGTLERDIQRVIQGTQRKAIDMGVTAGLALVTATNGVFGPRNSAATLQNAWSIVNESREASARVTQGNLFTEWGTELAFLAVQMAGTGGAGIGGRVAGEALATQGIRQVAKGMALRSQFAATVARPGITRNAEVAFARAMEGLAHGGGRKLGATVGVQASIFSQVAPYAYGDIFSAQLDRAITHANTLAPEERGAYLRDAQNMANLRATAGAVIVGTASMAINSRAGMNTFIAEKVGAKTMVPKGIREFRKGVSEISQKVQGNTARERLSSFSALSTKEKVLYMGNKLYAQGKMAVEGAAEELTDEFSEWLWTSLVRDGYIAEDSISTDDEVAAAAVKIAVLGAVGEVGASHLPGARDSRNLGTQAPSIPTTVAPANTLNTSFGTPTAGTTINGVQVAPIGAGPTGPARRANVITTGAAVPPNIQQQALQYDVAITPAKQNAALANLSPEVRAEQETRKDTLGVIINNIGNDTVQTVQTDLPESIKAEYVQGQEALAASAGHTMDNLSNAPVFTNTLIAEVGGTLSPETKAEWIQNGVAIGAENVTQLIAFTQNLKEEIAQADTPSGRQKLVEDALSNLGERMVNPTPQKREIMRSMIDQIVDHLSGQPMQESPITADSLFQPTGNETIDTISEVVNLATPEPVTPAAPVTQETETAVTTQAEPGETMVPRLPGNPEAGNAEVEVLGEQTKLRDVAPVKPDPLEAPVAKPLNTLLDSALTGEAPNEQAQQWAMQVIDGMETFDPKTAQWVRGNTTELTGDTIARMVTLDQLSGPANAITVTDSGRSQVVTANALLYKNRLPYEISGELSNYQSNLLSFMPEKSGDGMDLIDRFLTTEKITEGERVALTSIQKYMRENGIQFAVSRIHTDAFEQFNSPAMVDFADADHPWMIFNSMFTPDAGDFRSTFIHEAAHIVDQHQRRTNPEYANKVRAMKLAIRENWNDLLGVLKGEADASLEEGERGAIVSAIDDIAYGLNMTNVAEREARAAMDNDNEFASVLLSNPILRHIASQMVGSKENLFSFDSLTSPNVTALMVDQATPAKKGSILSRIIYKLKAVVGKILGRYQALTDNNFSLLKEMGEEWTQWKERQGDAIAKLKEADLQKFDPKSWALPEDPTAMRSSGYQTEGHILRFDPAKKPDLNTAFAPTHYGFSGELYGNLGDNWWNLTAGAVRKGRLGFNMAAAKFGYSKAMEKIQHKQVPVLTEQDALRVREQMTSQDMGQRYVIQQVHEIAGWLNKMGLKPSDQKIVATAIRDYVGNVDNMARPEVIQRIYADTQIQLDMAKTDRDAKIAAANDTVVRVKSAYDKELAASIAKIKESTGELAILGLRSSLDTARRFTRDKSMPADVDALNQMQALVVEYNSQRDEIARQIRELKASTPEYADGVETIKKETLAELDEALNAEFDILSRQIARELAEGEVTPTILLKKIRNKLGLKGLTRVASIGDAMETAVRNYRKIALAAAPEAARALHDIAQAKANAKKQIAEANATYDEQTRRAGYGADGTYHPAGEIYKVRDQMINLEHRYMQGKYLEKRERAEEILNHFPLIKQRLDRARRQIAQNQYDIYRFLGQAEGMASAQDMNWLHRTYLAVGAGNADVYRRAMTEAITDPNGKAVTDYQRGRLEAATKAYIEEHNKEVNGHISNVVDRMKTYAALFDHLTEQGITVEGKPTSYADLFSGIPASRNLRNGILDFLKANYSELQILSDLKHGDNMVSIVDKALAVSRYLGDQSSAERKKLRDNLSRIRRHQRDHARDTFIMESMGEDGNTNLRRFLSEQENVDSLIATLDSSGWMDRDAAKAIMDAPDTTMSQKVDRLLDYLRAKADQQMQRQGLGYTIDPSKLSTMNRVGLRAGMVDLANEAFIQTLSKKRSTENPLAMRKNLPLSERIILGELGDTSISEATGLIEASLSYGKDTVINMVMSAEAADAFLKMEVVSVEPKSEDDVLLSFRNTHNKLNGKYATKEMANELYRIFQPSEEVMTDETYYPGLKKYWKSNSISGIQKLAGMVNIAVLIKSPASTLRNLYGTAMQGINSGVWIPAYGLQEVGTMAMDMVRMHKLKKLAEQNTIAGREAQQKLLDMEERWSNRIKHYYDLGLLDNDTMQMFRNLWKSEEFQRAMEGRMEFVTDSPDALTDIIVGDTEEKGMVKRAATMLTVGLMKGATVVYSIPDAMAKIMSYTHERRNSENLMAVQLERAKSVAEEKRTPWQKELIEASQDKAKWENLLDHTAADRTKNLFPTGTRTPKWVKTAGIVMMPFFMFQYHTAQSVAYNMGYMVQELSDGTWALRNGMKKEGSKLMAKALGRATGTAAAVVAQEEVLRFLFTYAVRGALKLLDKEDDIKLITSDEAMKTAAKLGLIPDYDKFGINFGFFNKATGRWSYMNLEYATPFKNVAAVATSLFKLATGTEEERKEGWKEAENLMEGTIGAPSMAVSLLLNYAFDVNDKFKYQAEPRDSSEVGLAEAAFNAGMMAFGFQPTYGGGKTYKPFERMATAIYRETPVYSTLLNVAHQVGGDNPDNVWYETLLKHVGLGMRHGKQLSDAAAKAIKTAKVDDNAMKRMRLLNERNVDLNMDTLKRFTAYDVQQRMNAYADMGSTLNGMKALMETLYGDREGSKKFRETLDEANVSMKTARQAMRGRLPEVLTRNAVVSAFDRLDRESRKPGTSESRKQRITEQKKLIRETSRIRNVDVKEQMTTLEEYKQLFKNLEQ